MTFGNDIINFPSLKKLPLFFFYEFLIAISLVSLFIYTIYNGIDYHSTHVVNFNLFISGGPVVQLAR